MLPTCSEPEHSQAVKLASLTPHRKVLRECKESKEGNVRLGDKLSTSKGAAGDGP